MFCYATLLLNGYLPHYLAFFFYPSALQEKSSNEQKNKHRRSQEESNGFGDYEVSALYVLHFWNGIRP